MKKLALLLLALAIVAPLFADDAKVLPAGVLRTTISAAYNSFDEVYDSDGEAQDAGFEASIFNVGGAVEFGATEQITVAVQWAPGYNVSSSFSEDPIGLAANDKANYNGPLDLFIGAKTQILGPNGFVPNDMMRFAAAAGVTVPLKETDWEEEFDNYSAGDDYNLGSGSKEVLGVGFRLYYDYIVNKMFFINLYNETIFYPETETSNQDTALSQALSAQPIEDVKVAYGYKATFELEPNFTYPVNETLDITGTLQATYTMSPNIEVEGEEVEDTESNFFKLTPNVSAFMKAPLPLEFKAGYSIPVSGLNTQVASTFIFQLKSYLKF